MKQYMLSVPMIDGQPPHPPELTERMFEQTDKVNAEMQSAGVWVFAGGLHPVDRATVVRVESGTVTTTDGPFADTKEHLGGFWVIKCADLDEALGWAERCSVACMGPIEVRPFDDLSEA